MCSYTRAYVFIYMWTGWVILHLHILLFFFFDTFFWYTCFLCWTQAQCYWGFNNYSQSACQQLTWALLRKYRALSRECRALLREYRALLIKYRALFERKIVCQHISATRPAQPKYVACAWLRILACTFGCAFYISSCWLFVLRLIVCFDVDCLFWMRILGCTFGCAL